MNVPELAFYASAGPLTALPADVGDVPTDPDGVRTLMPSLLVHTAWLSHYGLEEPPVDARQTRSAIETIAEVRGLDPRPLGEARQPTHRAGVVCRHYSTLAVALLRNAGIPARARCGFATYFEPAKYIDHWVIEYRDGARWVRSDAQLDETQRDVLGIAFDPSDLPDGAFLDAGEAWLRVRAGEADANRFGIFDFWGAWFIRSNVWRDLAALNKVEMLPWDVWGAKRPKDAFVDEVAGLVHDGDFEARRARYAGDKALRMPGRVTSFTPAGLRKERVAIA